VGVKASKPFASPKINSPPKPLQAPSPLNSKSSFIVSVGEI